MQRRRTPRLVVALLGGALTVGGAQGCVEDWPAIPEVDGSLDGAQVTEDQSPGDDLVEPGEDVSDMDAALSDIAPADDAAAKEDAAVEGDATAKEDAAVEGDATAKEDAAVEDVATPPDDAPTAPPCPTPTAPTRVDPCATRGSDCGFPSTARVSISGARTALTEFQVRVELPMGVRAAVGASCDRMVFRTAEGAWAPHFVTDCAMGVVWVRAPAIAPTGTTLTLRYGGSTPLAAANSYDDTFDRVPTRAANVLGAYSFDEGTGARTCPAAGTTPFDAYILQDRYRSGHPEIRGADPELWSAEAPPSVLAPTNPEARFRRGQHSLNFPLAQLVDSSAPPDAGSTPGRPINWRSATSAPFDTARDQLTVGIWVRPLSPANAFEDNFQTVACFGMPDLAARARHWMIPETDQRMIDSAIFNPWAIFFRSDGTDESYYQGNTCVEPCTEVIQYAHITTTEPLASTVFVNRWHFLAFTFDRTTTPHTTRRSYYDDRVYSYPESLELFPQDRVYCPNPLSFSACNPAEGQPTTCSVPCEPLCPGGHGPCINPPDAPIMYPPAPVMLGADFNDGVAQLGIQGQIDDFFVINRAISPDEMRAYRERRQYSADPVIATVTP
ncbi:MAG: hypothetical protein R3A48_26610 [Polyangiales bacterium]